ncbi:hypothetical protein D0867_08667 [Hortaea werneckii]|uniref:Uncharacterized protein n=1 Tax=Hortaea werneckii TaxID=91943 RepID=A0A3M6Z389_HORWE|nr:hypothetical protein D0867_08667 [Hortaea werneckii]
MSASLAPECNEVKEYALPVFHQIRRNADTTHQRRYDTCFLKWYSEIQDLLERTSFFPQTHMAIAFGQRKTDSCTQKALKDRGIDQMLEDARVDNKENDIEYMKPNGR